GETSSHQDQDQDQDEGQDQVRAPAERPNGPPGPGGISDGLDDGPELYRLEQAWRARELEPVDVVLGKLPPHAGVVMRNIADHMRLLMGLRLAVGDDRPLPYAASLAVKAGYAADKGTAGVALNSLVRGGVV